MSGAAALPEILGLPTRVAMVRGGPHALLERSIPWGRLVLPVGGLCMASIVRSLIPAFTKLFLH